MEKVLRCWACDAILNFDNGETKCWDCRTEQYGQLKRVPMEQLVYDEGEDAAYPPLL